MGFGFYGLGFKVWVFRCVGLGLGLGVLDESGLGMKVVLDMFFLG